MAYSYSIDDPAKNSKRTLAFVLVVIIHALFFWVLASGLGAKMVQTVMGPVETKIIEELPEDDKEPPPPPPDIEQPPPYVPPPEVSVELADRHRPDHGNFERRPASAPWRRRRPPSPSNARPSRCRLRRTGAGARITQPEYPPASRRAGEAGTVTLQVTCSKPARPAKSRSQKIQRIPETR